jgi:hypothetical protein
VTSTPPLGTGSATAHLERVGLDDQCDARGAILADCRGGVGEQLDAVAHKGVEQAGDVVDLGDAEQLAGGVTDELDGVGVPTTRFSLVTARTTRTASAPLAVHSSAESQVPDVHVQLTTTGAAIRNNITGAASSASTGCSCGALSSQERIRWRRVREKSHLVLVPTLCLAWGSALRQSTKDSV